MGKAGMVLAIIGAVIGLLSVLLGLAIPALFSWYHYDLSTPGYSGGLYLTAFGSIISDPSGADFEVATLVLLGGIMVLAGAGLCIVAAATKMKPLGIIGGILMIVGPIMLIIDLASVGSEFAEYMDNIATYTDKSIFFDTFSYAGYSVVWGLWVGFFMAIAGGVVGLIGGATLSE
ncbi:MAG: hypothetical protein ACFFAQ_11960 [Promethearchaeota archaeon]